MPLRTVKVPAAMEGVFAAAEAVVSKYFSQREENPEHGTIEIFGERYVLVRAASLSVEFFGLVDSLHGPGREVEAAGFSRDLLFGLAHAIGKSDAQNFHGKMGLEEPIARLSAGPVHFAHTGWASVDISEESRPGPAQEYYLLYDHPYSFESDAWLRANKSSDFPVCIMNAGYSSGWCEESFGVELVAAEILCRAKGDACCRFIMAHPDEIEGRIGAYVKSNPELAPRMGTYRIPDYFSSQHRDKEADAARFELELRVAERTEQLRLANQRLKREVLERAEVEKRLHQSQRIEALGRLAGGIAHDFNNLLMAIGGYSEVILRRDNLDPELTHLVGEIASATDRGAKLTDQLLVFSRHQVITPRILDLSDVVRALESLLRRLLGEDVRLETRLPAESARLLADLGRLEQVIVNLAVNARDAMPPGGTLTLEVAVDPSHVELVVSDSGCGMDPETIAQIFDPFFTTKEVGKGTGLGLATVYAIVQQTNGAISVESRLDVGTSFRVRFPRVFDDVYAGDSPVAPVDLVPAEAGILLVEDDETVRTLVSSALKASGYRIEAATDAAEALRLFERSGRRFDLLLTDVVLPGQSGTSLAKALHDLDPNLKTIFMSGYTDDRLPERLENLCGSFLQKPFSLSTLEQKIRELLS